MSVIDNGLFSTFLVDLGIQVGFYLISAPLKTEKLFDFSGALTYMACVLNALLNRPEAPNYNLHPRQIIVSVFTLLWCTRLGLFLFYRVLRAGHDKRFDEIKKDPVSDFCLTSIPVIRLGAVFFAQVVWVWLTAFPVYIVAANPSATQPPLQWSDIIGIVIWAAGYLCEVVSDVQKNSFKNKYPNDFISTGLWKYSRHPNYFGEVLLWIGMFWICAAGFVEAWQWVGIVSPVFVFYLLYFGSGVKLLEESSDKRYGHLGKYQYYKARTSIFIPLPPSSSVKLADFKDIDKNSGSEHSQ
ncbi:hypothetical protein BKA69DRAFT_1108982 [Paraphysoderma sedebokerense]|nr:hypothetical protein BKA69DRAFT_1108982 [Paraphysoderma sedebokerense]